MKSIKEFLTHDHRACDDIFAQMEDKASSSLKDTTLICKEFCDAMEHHFQMEERVMFPEFEMKTGMTQGPTEMMRAEHTQMRSLMAQLNEAIEKDNSTKFFGLTETLIIYMQQHNMKEEQMLYNMAQQHLSAESERVVDMMESMIVQ